MTALQVFSEAFKSARSPRSSEYKAGVLACLRNRLEDCTSPPPYADGTVQSDAWFAGWDEGRIWVITEKARRAKHGRGPTLTVQGDNHEAAFAAGEREIARIMAERFKLVEAKP